MQHSKEDRFCLGGTILNEVDLNPKGERMDYVFLPAWPPQLNEAMRIAVALLFAGLAGEVFARFVRLPRLCCGACCSKQYGNQCKSGMLSSLPDLGIFGQLIDRSMKLADASPDPR